MEKLEVGRKGEALALEYLLHRGFKLLEKNWRCRHLEVDLIMEKRGEIHFVEVRSLTGPVLQEPYMTVGNLKQRRIMAAASCFVTRYRIDAEVRFDVVSVVFGRSGARVEFIPDAFIPIR